MTTTVIVVHEGYEFEWTQGTMEVCVSAPPGRDAVPIELDVRLEPGFGISAVEDTARKWVDARCS